MYFIQYKKPFIRMLVFVFISMLYACSAGSESEDEVMSVFDRFSDLNAPQQLQYSDLGAASVTLTWDQVEKAEFYKLYLNGEEIDTVYGATQYVYANLLPESLHRFSIQACNASLCSDLSDELEVTTGTSNPNPSGTTIQTIIDEGAVPADLSPYSVMAQEVFSNYSAGTTIQVRYVTENGSGTLDGSSWDNAANDIKTVLDGISDASATQMYMVAIATGTYAITETLSMKNNVAIVGGFTAGTLEYSDTASTVLSGNNAQTVFSNTQLDSSALLFGVSIINGFSQTSAGAMHNQYSSPTLTRVMFTGNISEGWGGAVYNEYSFPVFTNVTFDNNTAATGGAMANVASSPQLFRVTFYNNTATNAGAMANAQGTNALIFNATFVNNTATEFGGAILNNNNNSATPYIINTLFWGNSDSVGSTIYVYNDNNVGEEHMVIHNSILESGMGNDSNNNALISGNAVFGLTGGGLASYASGYMMITFHNVSDADPLTGTLANGLGITTVPIGVGSPAINKGLYIRLRKLDMSLYFSEDNTVWYRSVGTTGLANEVTLPENVIDPLAIDENGDRVSDAPDIGAHEL